MILNLIGDNTIRRKPIEYETNDNGCILIVSHAPIKNGGHIYLKINGKQQSLHRFIYESHHGEIPDNMVIRHKCDNPNCANIEHLEIGTHQENVQDRVKRNRTAKGKNNGRAKMDEDKVRFVRDNPNLSNTELARMFGVDRKVIYNIRNNINWINVS